MSGPPPKASAGMWKRFALAAVLIVVLSAGSAATAGFMEVREIASAFSLGETIETGEEITASEAGKPQTLLLLGSDKRVASDPVAKGARSDTIMLVRLNPKADAVTLMSIPRDLRVDIPGVGSDKINRSYDEGGPRLTLKTVKQLLGIDINHVINVNFRGFSDIVDSLGCVYVDIDRRYFNENPAFADIDIQPGYQKLCGYDSLEYARFREEDTDLVRAARQQDFLRQAKAQVSGSKLFSKREKLLKIFGKYADTDRGLRSPRQVQRLLNLAVFSARKPVAQVEFPAIIPNDPKDTYVRYRERALRKAVEAFMTGRSRVTEAPKLKPTKEERKTAARRKRKSRSQAKGPAGLEDAERPGEDQAIAIAGRVPYPVYFPRLRIPLSTYVDNAPRVYRIRANGRSYASYRMVLKKSGIGEYYGVQATSWRDPPILSEPHETQKVGGRSFDVYYNGRRIRLVAWKGPKAVYWITNTLAASISNREMLRMAASLKKLG